MEIDQATAKERIGALLREVADHYKDIGNLHYYARELPEAEAAYRRALEADPRFYKAHYNLGNVLYDLGRYEEAVAAWRETVTLKPGHMKARFNLAHTLDDVLKRRDEAFAEWKRIVTMNPEYAEAWTGLGKIHLAREEFDEALRCLAEATRLDPTDRDARFYHGIALHDTGDLAAAALKYREVLAAAPDDPDALNNLADALQQLGRSEEALGTVERALAARPNHPPALCTRGEILESLGRFKEAARDFAATVKHSKMKDSILARYAGDRARTITGGGKKE